jgi:hypothetical protein
MIGWCGGLLDDGGGWIIDKAVEVLAAVAEDFDKAFLALFLVFFSTSSWRLPSKSFLSQRWHLNVSFIPKYFLPRRQYSCIGNWDG